MANEQSNPQTKPQPQSIQLAKILDLPGVFIQKQPDKSYGGLVTSIQAADSSLAATAAIATPQVAAAVVVTAILCPFMTNWISKHTGKEVKTTFSQVEEKVAEENATY